MPNKHKKPPQGTHRIMSEKRQARIKHGAEKIIDQITAYIHMEHNGGEDWEDMKQDTEPNFELFRRLSDEHGKAVVGQAWKHWRFARYQ